MARLGADTIIAVDVSPSSPQDRTAPAARVPATSGAVGAAATGNATGNAKAKGERQRSHSSRRRAALAVPSATQGALVCRKVGPRHLDFALFVRGYFPLSSMKARPRYEAEKAYESEPNGSHNFASSADSHGRRPPSDSYRGILYLSLV
jgi:hypothetical protein